ncbi:MAG TPA: helix-turn-helix transcriptional regulator [Terriglobales bacterium]
MKQQPTFTEFMGTMGQRASGSLSLSYLETTRKSEMIQKGNEKPLSEEGISSAERPKSTDLNSIDRIIERLKKGQKARAQFVDSNVNKGIAYQLRALRDRQDLSQEKLSEMVGMNQNAISRLESPSRTRPTITTLKRLAEALDVGLEVRFVPFSKLAKWYSGTPYVERGICTDSLAVPDFTEELAAGAFQDQTSAVPHQWFWLKQPTGTGEIFLSGQVALGGVSLGTQIEPANVSGQTGQFAESRKLPIGEAKLLQIAHHRGGGIAQCLNTGEAA